jgi:hypothetical protein
MSTALIVIGILLSLAVGIAALVLTIWFPGVGIMGAAPPPSSSSGDSNKLSSSGALYFEQKPRTAVVRRREYDHKRNNGPRRRHMRKAAFGGCGYSCGGAWQCPPEPCR